MTRAIERREAKRAAILAAATDLITEFGYDGTSLDAVVDRAGCSKSAIYELFGNKEGLLSALSEDIAGELTEALEALGRERLPVRETLERYGRLALKLILAPGHAAIVRATMAAAWKHPEIGRRYYEAGPLAARESLAAWFAERTRAGELDIDDAAEAAREFQSLLFVERLMARVATDMPTPGRPRLKSMATRAANGFLRMYGVD